MTRIDRRGALLVCAGGVLAGCSLTEEIAGGRKKPRGGIGGTGVVGTLTDFGSLMVNGLRIETAPDLVVASAVGALEVGDLAVGHSLTIEAATENGVLVAKRVVATHPLVGVLRRRGGRLTVAGVPVRVEEGAAVRVRPGRRAAVSGIWHGQEVVASRIDPAPRGAPDVVAGTMRRRPDGGWQIGSAPVTLGLLQVPAPDGFATATGRAGKSGFTVSTLATGRFTGAAGELTALSVEGYLAPAAAAPYYTVDGLGHSFGPASPVAPFAGLRTLFRGPYDGLFQMETGLALPETLEDRRAAMRALQREGG